MPVTASDELPGFFWPVLAGTSVVVPRLRAKILSGTSVTIDVTQNGVAIADFTGLVVTTVPTDFTATTPIAVTDNDQFDVVVTAVSGSPVGLSVTLVNEVSA